MSVTIRIQGNEEYLRNNKPELIKKEYLDFSDPYDAVMRDYYPEGYREFFPFELNLANGNFYALWIELGFFSNEDMYSGSISPEILISYLNQFQPKALVSNSYEENNLFVSGRSIEQVTRYYWELMSICNEAKKRNALIIWS